MSRCAGVAETWDAYLRAACVALEVPYELCKAIDPKRHARGGRADAVTRKAFLARTLATYCTNVLANVPQASIARVLGVSRKNVCVPIRHVEDARDDGRFEDVIQKMAALVGVEAAK